ncbi:hypothetical protein [Pseudosporangium ferrugineum]|uniref:hypothetical protein n=1 Tax=Pseudosporangium ferrugineum TaxID=439699 RepID=UPI00130486E4|nr:hypothetical protein [Pseudosporangium ferrugineum]
MAATPAIGTSVSSREFGALTGLDPAGLGDIIARLDPPGGQANRRAADSTRPR